MSGIEEFVSSQMRANNGQVLAPHFEPSDGLRKPRISSTSSEAGGGGDNVKGVAAVLDDSDRNSGYVAHSIEQRDIACQPKSRRCPRLSPMTRKREATP